MKKQLALSFAAILLIAGALAKAAEGPALMTGVGASDDSCGNWLAARRVGKGPISTQELMTLSWAQGYLSGMNGERLMAGRAFVMPTHPTLAAYLDEECRKDPMSPVMVHLEKMTSRLTKTQPLKTP